MSRFFDVRITVDDSDLNDCDAVKDAIDSVYHFDYYDLDSPIEGKVELVAGNSVEELAKTLTHAVWKANRGYCDVAFDVLLPTSISLGHDDYVRFAANQPKGWEYDEDNLDG